MTDAPPTLPSAAWYPDPQNPDQQRWWTGETWGAHIRLPPMPATLQPAPAWQLNQPLGATPPQANFDALDEQIARATRRGFFDSPFERPGTPRNTLGTLALILALLAFVVAGLLRPLSLFLGVPLGIAAIVLGIVGIARAGRIGARRGTAIAGLIVGLVFVLAVIGTIVVAVSTTLANIQASPNIETNIASGIRAQTGETVTVDCPKNAPTGMGASFACTGTDSGGGTFEIAVTFTNNNGMFTWEFKR